MVGFVLELTRHKNLTMTESNYRDKI